MSRVVGDYVRTTSQNNRESHNPTVPYHRHLFPTAWQMYRCPRCTMFTVDLVTLQPLTDEDVYRGRCLSCFPFPQSDAASATTSSSRRSRSRADVASPTRTIDSSPSNQDNNTSLGALSLLPSAQELSPETSGVAGVQISASSSTVATEQRCDNGLSTLISQPNQSSGTSVSEGAESALSGNTSDVLFECTQEREEKESCSGNSTRISATNLVEREAEKNTYTVAASVPWVQVFENKDLADIILTFMPDVSTSSSPGVTNLRAVGKLCCHMVDQHLTAALDNGNIRGRFRLLSTRHLLQESEDKFSDGVCGQLNGDDFITLVGRTVLDSNGAVALDLGIRGMNLSTMCWSNIAEKVNIDNDCKIRALALSSSRAFGFGSKAWVENENEVVVSSECEYAECFTLDMSASTNVPVWVRHCCPGARPVPRRSDTAAYAIVKEKLYVFGGGKIRNRPGSIKEFGNDLWELDLETYQWNEVQKEGIWPPAMSDPVCVVVGTTFSVFGGNGYKADQKHLRKNIWVFDTVARRWSCPKLSGKRPTSSMTQFSHAVAVGNTIICVGNVGRNHAEGGCVYTLDAVAWKWARVEVEGETWCARAWGHLVVAKKQHERIKLFFLGGQKRKLLSSEDNFVSDLFELEFRLIHEDEGNF